MPITQRRRWVEAAALLLVPLALGATVPYSPTVYATSAQCTVDGSNWILYLGDQTAPYAWDAAANPDGSEFRDRTQRMHLHTTTPAQSITCHMHGTGISVLGGLQIPRGLNTTDPNVLNITLDGQPLARDGMTLTPSNDTWKSTFLQVPPRGGAPLTSGMHTLQIQTGAAFHGALKMWGMVANTSVPTDGWKPYSTPGAGSSTGHELPFVFNSSVASTMYNWKDSDPGVHNFGLQNVEAPEVAVAVRGEAEATVNLPKNSSYLVVHGYSGPNYGTLFVDLDPAPPGISTLPIERNTNKPWLVYDTLFETPLDPAEEYTVKYTTKKDALGAGVYLASTNVFEYKEDAMNPFTGGWQDGTKPKKKNLGVIIGAAVGGSLGGILLLGLLIFFWRRHSAAKKAKLANTPSEEGSSDSTHDEGDAALEKRGSARASLRPPSMSGGRPKSGMSERRKSEMSMMLDTLERDKRKSAQSAKSGRQSRRQSEMPPHMLAGDYRKDLESWLLPNGAYSGGALRQSRPISSTSGRGLLDGLTVPTAPRYTRSNSSTSGRGLLDHSLNVPPPTSRTTSYNSTSGLPPLDTAAAAEASPPPNLSPVEQTFATLTGKSTQSPPRAPASLPLGADEPVPAPFAVKQATPTAAGSSSFPSADTPASPAAGPPTRAPPSPPPARSGRESAASQATFFSLPDESEADVANTTVGSEGFFSAQSHDAPALVFLQPNSSGTRPPSRQAIPKAGEGEGEEVWRAPAVDETQYTPGTAM